MIAPCDQRASSNARVRQAQRRHNRHSANRSDYDDFQPPGAHADVGWMRFETPDRLIEVGALQDYDEIWERLPESTGHYRVLAECGADGEHVVGLWLLAGIWLMHVQPTLQPWPDDLQVGDDLAALVGRHPRQADAWLSTEISFGRWQDGLWTIERSTQGALEGQQFICAMRRDGPDEAAIALAEQPGTTVTLSYRSKAFSRVKEKNRQRLQALEKAGRLAVLLESTVQEIGATDVQLVSPLGLKALRNDAVIVCAGGVLPTALLQSIGVRFETKFGTA